jgi:hypothetical protein
MKEGGFSMPADPVSVRGQQEPNGWNRWANIARFVYYLVRTLVILGK